MLVAATVFTLAVVFSYLGLAPSLTAVASSPPNGAGEPTLGSQLPGPGGVVAAVVTPTAPRYVQSALGYTGSLVSSQRATFSNPVAAGDLIVVAVSTWNNANTSTVARVVDSYGNTYTKATEDPTPPTSGEEPLSIWYAANVKGGASFSVTAIVQNAGSFSVAIHEYAGAALTNVVDRAAHSNGSNTVASVGLTSPTTSANDLLFAASTFSNIATVGATAGGGYNPRQSQSNDICCNALFTADASGGPSGLYTASFNFAQSVNYRSTIVAFRPATPALVPTATPTGSTPTPFRTVTPTPSRTPATGSTSTITRTPTRIPVATQTASPTSSSSLAITPTRTATRTATPTTFVTMTTTPAIPSSASEWSQHGHDAQHTSFTNQEVATPWKWKWSWNGPDVNGGVAAGKTALPVNVQPVTGGGQVYVAAGGRGVFALNEGTGAVQWNATNIGTINSTAAYDADTTSLFVISTSGILFKLNPTNGTIIGQFNTAASSTLPLPPAIIGDRVLVSMGTRVFAIDKRTMTQIWVYDAGSVVQTPPGYSPSRNRVLVGSQDLYIHAINNANGAQVWRVKPTVRTPGDPAGVANTLAQVLDGWPVIAEKHGLVLVRYRLDWNTMWTWSPWPTDNASMRSNLQSQPGQQSLFALSLDTGAVPFVSNVGNGGMGDGGYLPMGPQPVVKQLPDGNEVVYTVIRGNTVTDGRWDSKFGEMVLDSTTVPGLQAGDVRFIYYDQSGSNNAWPNPYIITDEQPNVTMAGNYLFGGHWMAGYAVQIADRSSSRGQFNNPITTNAVPQITNSSASCAFSASHYCPNGVTQVGDPRNYGPSGFYIYYNQPGVYSQYSSGYASWVVSNSTIYFVSIDGAIVALGNGISTAAAVTNAVAAPIVSANVTPVASGSPNLSGLVSHVAALPQELVSSAQALTSGGAPVIDPSQASDNAGQVRTVEGTIEYVFNNRQAVYLRFENAYRGGFVVRIMKEHWDAFGDSPDHVYKIGQKIRVTGLITWYKGDPVIYVEDPTQIDVAR